MKTRLFAIIVMVVSVSITTYIDSTYAIHDESGAHTTPFGYYEIFPPPLKHQLENDLDDIKCPNKEHVLIQRSNEKLACVNPYTMAKLEWDPVDISLWSKIIRFEQPFAIFTHLSETQNAKSVTFDEEANSIGIHVISDKSEKLSVNVNRAILETPTKDCEIPEWSPYFVLVNGEEVAYENKLTTDHYRYLEIQFEPQVESDQYHLRGANDIHRMYDIPYDENSIIIEIIGTCLI